MRVFVQFRIAVRGQHFAVGVNVDALPRRLLQKLVQILQIVTGHDDERPFFDIRVDARGYGVAEGICVRAVKQRHALEVHPAELHQQRQPLLHAVFARERGKAVIEPRAHLLVLIAEAHGMVCIGRHALESEEQRGAERHDVRRPAPEPFRLLRNTLPASAQLVPDPPRESADGLIVEVHICERGEQAVCE